MNTKSDGFKVLLGVLGGLAAIIVFGLLLSFAPELAKVGQPTPTPGGIAAGQYREAPDVTLINQDNQPMSLADLKGKTVMMIFGYTRCPDVCPMGMSDLRRVKRELGDTADQAAFVFVSVDPERDTPAVIKPYVKAFDESFIGLTGDVPALQKFVYAFDGLFEKQKPTGDDPNVYVMAHTSFTYLIDADGKWRMKYPFGTPVETLVRDMRATIATDGSASS
jgi:protein SCO1/2